MTQPAWIESAPQLLDAPQLQRTVTRLAHEIAERHPQLDGVVLAGIRTRGVPLARRVAVAMGTFGDEPAVAALDPSGHRDDRPRPAGARGAALQGLDGELPPRVDGATVIMVDDVVYTGRTLRAALDALVDHGRPAVVELLALVDRGHREVPLRATFVGKNVPTAPGDRVCVRLREVDGIDGAWLVQEARV